MSKYATFCYCLFLISTPCLAQQPLDEQRLSEIPTPPHNNPVEIYFPGQLPEDPEYYPITILEVEGQEGAYSYNALILMIQALAQKEGIDAIMLIGREFRTTGFEGNISSYPVLSGVGIKYVRNITYLHHYVKTEKFSVPDGLGKREAVTIRYSMDGRQEGIEPIEPQDHRYYQNYLSKYSLDHLYYQTNHWKGGKTLRFDPKRQLFYRKRSLYNGAGIKMKSVKTYFEGSKDIPVEIEVSKPVKVSDWKVVWQVERVCFSYRDDGQVSQKRILREDHSTLWIFYHYDPEGRLLEIEGEEHKEGVVQPCFWLERVFYDRSDLDRIEVIIPDLYFKASRE